MNNFLKSSKIILIGILYVSLSYSANPYSILKKIPTYTELSIPKKINTYQVPVTATGNIWNEIISTSKLGDKNVHLVEYYKSPDHFILTAKEDKTAPARIISGMMDPVYVYNFILRELESYKKKEIFKKIKSGSNASLSETDESFILEFNPKNGKMIASHFSDHGPETVLTKLLWLRATVEKGSYVLKKLEIKKISKIRTMGKSDKPEKLHDQKIDFKYIKREERYYPVEMHIYENNTLTFRLFAEFILVDKKYFLPAKKILEYLKGDKTERLLIDYGKYELNKKLPKNIFNNPKTSSLRIKKANQIAINGEQAFKNGDIRKARRMFETLVQQYPKSPQAKQARIFLSGLPD